MPVLNGLDSVVSRAARKCWDSALLLFRMDKLLIFAQLRDAFTWKQYRSHSASLFDEWAMRHHRLLHSWDFELHELMETL